MREIIIENASENNLKHISLRIPHYRLIVVTGVSGSGKTSLVYDVISAEGQRLFFENFAEGRLSNANLPKPQAGRIEGLFPVVAIDQNSYIRSPRSTVGTLTELYDLLRLLFARLGKSETLTRPLHRSLFSFNLPDGYCEVCKGLGVRDHIDTSLLIGDAEKTIRDGAFVLTTPNNYIVYSQVTMDVLDQVCRAEGFSVDIPWNDLTDAQKKVVLYGSSKIKVLFGKHPLESRLRWTGITAKPREEDYYKGIVTVMEDILRRERNPNIMRFARSYVCDTCGGRRLNSEALSVTLWGRDISQFASMNIRQLHAFFSTVEPSPQERAVVEPIRNAVLRRTSLNIRLGAGHLSLNRESLTLNGGEAQRIRLANMVHAGLRNVLYILDEPSAGLHPSEHASLLEVLHTLVQNGNTVILVDHDEQSIRAADWIIDLGPGAGKSGGQVLYNGTAAGFFSEEVSESITRKLLTQSLSTEVAQPGTETGVLYQVVNADRNNLRKISPRIMLQGFNVVTGVSGSGKTSLAEFLLRDIEQQKVRGEAMFRKVIHIDSSPIGRTPKSNPATYTGLSDHVRDLFAALPESKKRGYKKGQFSFVVKGGRCESCGGAGVQQIGMHFLGNVEVLCEVCEGKRFTKETLSVLYEGKNIYDILELTVDDAHDFFKGLQKITAITGILQELGLGYLKLGQPSTTLSGGEARRIKLASELIRTSTGNTLCILDEPATGLHLADIEILLKALHKLRAKGNTLLCIEHDPAFILQADRVIDLGPGSADEGGAIVAEGTVSALLSNNQSETAYCLREFLKRDVWKHKEAGEEPPDQVTAGPISLSRVETNNLKGISVAFPVDAITAVTGVSGSGKSSLVYGTLYAESRRRFMDGFGSYIRQFAAKTAVPVLEDAGGLLPAIALRKKNPVSNPRSTVATYCGLYDVYRLMFSRLSHSGSGGENPLSGAFSFNTEEGACPVCRGLGKITVCDADKLITHPGKPLIAGAMDGTKTGGFYGDPSGQYVAALLTAGSKYGIDFSLPYRELDETAQKIAMEGCGEEIFEVEWNYKRGSHQGVHRLKTKWQGFLQCVESEYYRKHNDARGEAMLGLMKHVACRFCGGYRLKPEWLDYRIDGLHIGQLTALASEEALPWIQNRLMQAVATELEQKAALAFQAHILPRLRALMHAGLGYIATDRVVGTLSGGEFQRLQLAGLTRAPLTGVAYILDEPSFGLHPEDAKRIRNLVCELNRLRNTVIMVDNSPLMHEKAQYLIELGPGAGEKGGEVVFSGPAESKPAEEAGIQTLVATNLPGQYVLKISKASANNLRHVDADFPSGILSAITGVSGSGKTSLLDDVIYASFLAGRPVHCERISGFEQFAGLICMQQSTGHPSRMATVGSYLGLTEIIAKVFAAADLSKTNLYKSACFIPGSPGGRCNACEGTGRLTVSMDYFSEVNTPCERCGGTGFRDEMLAVEVGGCSVFDILCLTLAELTGFLGAHTGGREKQKVLRLAGLAADTGLEYLSAGRMLKTLSTGELQRIRLLREIAEKAAENALILLDEPTGGLHPKDVRKLLQLFSGLISRGNTIVCVTHEPLLIQAAGRVIELGPGGGRNGGHIINCR